MEEDANFLPSELLRILVFTYHVSGVPLPPRAQGWGLSPCHCTYPAEGLAHSPLHKESYRAHSVPLRTTSVAHIARAGGDHAWTQEEWLLDRIPRKQFLHYRHMFPMPPCVSSVPWAGGAGVLNLVGSTCYCVHVCSVTQSYPALCDPMDCSPAGSSVHGIFQARIVEWVAISSPRRSSPPRDQTRVSCVSCLSWWILHHWVTH